MPGSQSQIDEMGHYRATFQSDSEAILRELDDQKTRFNPKHHELSALHDLLFVAYFNTTADAQRLEALQQHLLDGASPGSAP